MKDKNDLIHSVCLQHAIFKTKTELDQLKDGLSTLGVNSVMCMYQTLLKPFFTNSSVPLTAGKELTIRGVF